PGRDRRRGADRRARVRPARPRAARPAGAAAARGRRRVRPGGARAARAVAGSALMERGDWTVVAHGGVDLLNPIPVAKLDEVIDLLALPAGGRVVDLGCGKGELLRRLANRYEIRGVGVDRSAVLVDEARRRAPAGITFVVADLTAFATGAPFDLAASLGSSVD